MVAPADRQFPTFARGELRDLYLDALRYELRHALNPDTGQPFTEGEIQAVTSELSRDYKEANALDLVMLAVQQRGQWLADQALETTASDSWLKEVHGPMWGIGDPLPASGGGGTITWKATPGTTFLGSTTLPTGYAHKIAIGAVTYQVLFSEVTSIGGVATLRVRALSTGLETNAKTTQIATPITQPSGADPAGIGITANFTGGAPAETAQEYANRISAAKRDKEGAGNQAQLRALAKGASAAVETAWVYPCALEAGSTIIAVGAKRGNTVGPTARIAGQTVVDDVVAYLTPPGSPVLPPQPWLLGVAQVPENTDVAVRLTMAKKSVSGWTDLVPWPTATAALVLVSNVTDQQHFKIDVGGAGAPPNPTPALMVWNNATSAFELLAVVSVSLDAGNVYNVVLGSAPAATIAVGMAVSPGNGQADAIGLALGQYFDALGPGELVNLSTSTLAHRAYRWPPPDEEYTTDVGGLLLTYLQDALGAAITNSSLPYTSVSTPTLPASPELGPHQLVIRHFGIYPL
jgi:hypothetical protein